MLDEDEVPATPSRLARLYRAAMDPGQTRLDHVLEIHGLRPDSLDGHLRLYRAAMYEREGLGRREREVLGVAVSAASGCRY